jgi:hypothetical protein
LSLKAGNYVFWLKKTWTATISFISRSRLAS